MEGRVLGNKASLTMAIVFGSAVFLGSGCAERTTGVSTKSENPVPSVTAPHRLEFTLGRAENLDPQIGDRLRSQFIRCDAFGTSENGDEIIAPINLPQLSGRAHALGKARITTVQLISGDERPPIKLQCGLPTDVDARAALHSLTYSQVANRVRSAGRGRVYSLDRKLKLHRAVSLGSLQEAQKLGLMSIDVGDT
jgi:hypothetical protein